MYPLKFKPILKEVLWGGERIFSLKGLPADGRCVGESWEVSTVPAFVSVVENGAWKGTALTELIAREKGAILGEKNYQKYGNNLPLLFKFIDTKDHCSVQVHPNDDLAQARHASPGKTEIWYVIDAAPDAMLISGFSKEISEEEYRRRVQENTLEEVLVHHAVKSGDVFFIPAGRIHAIGRGLLVAEIQQNTDITYRVYDYGRKDAQGCSRTLHTEEAVAALDFSVLSEDDLKQETAHIHAEHTELIDCEFFNVNLLNISENTQKDYRSLDSFVVYMCVQGACEIAPLNLPKGEDFKGEAVFLRQGESVLIPAVMGAFEIRPNAGADVKLLECYV
ncbi:MAG: class I mannose-6-phosphate isomerase [Bacteroidales bacterium]|jgi:mannose-6-phosphate isomerase|nr:class I mannose-6-phosphate isomerase [Bacteroidales bacterium]